MDGELGVLAAAFNYGTICRMACVRIRMSSQSNLFTNNHNS